MNAQNPCPRFGPGSRLVFRAPGERTSMMGQINLPPPILDEQRADAAEAFGVDPATHESVDMPIDRNLADEAIAYCQTASRAHRQGALKDAAATLHTR